MILTVCLIIGPVLVGNIWLYLAPHVSILFLLPSRLPPEKSTFLSLCRVQIIFYSLTLNIVLTTEVRKEMQRLEN